MKKLLVLVAMVGLAISATAQSYTISTNIINGAGLHLITTNRVRVYSIEITTTNAYNLKFWDNDNTVNTPTSTASGWWGTNFVNGAYVSRSTYPTSYVNSYVGYNNYTNWYTNAGIWSVTLTNSAATNATTAIYTAATSGAETRVNYVDVTFSRGVLVYTTGNAAITLYCRSEQ